MLIFRELDKLKKPKSENKGKTPPKKAAKPETRAERLKREKKREAATLRQRKRRASMSPKQKEAEREKERQRYRLQKEATNTAKARNTPSDSTGTLRPLSYFQFLKQTLAQIKMKRDRLSLTNMHLLKRCLKKTSTLQGRTFYQRTKPREHMVEDFYQKIAVNLPGKNVNTKSMAPKKVLPKRVADVYNDFKKEHPGSKISLTTFSRRRPENVMLAGSHAFYQCLCEFCENPNLKLKKLNRFLKNKICDVEALVNSTLCEKEGGFSRDCMERNCESCGVDTVTSAWKREIENLDEEVTWLKWEKTELAHKDQVEKKGTLRQLIGELEKEMATLALHLKTARWQRNQYQLITENMPRACAVVTMDFAENYKCRFQNEIQSAHWSYKQVTVHPTVLHYQCPEENCHTIVHDYIVHLSDDLKHDGAFTKKVMDEILHYLAEKNLDKAVIFSDGCSAQYKSKLPFLHLTELASDHPDQEIERHYFGAHHGKSLCDSCGGVVKKMATVAVASGSEIIQSAKDFKRFADSKLVLPKSAGNESEMHKPDSPHVKRSFRLLTSQDLDRSQTSSTLTTMAGSRKLHALKPTKHKGTVQFKSLSCFCNECRLGGSAEKCINRKLTGSWKIGNVHGSSLRTNNKKRKNKEQAEKKKQSKTAEDSSCSTTSSPAFEDTPSSTLPPSAGHQECSRKTFFEKAHADITKAKSYSQLKEMCFNFKLNVLGWPMVAETADDIQVDLNAFSKMPEENAGKYIPMSVDADGNCFFRSISYLSSGSVDHHSEFRTRLIVEMATNEDQYTDEEYLRKAADMEEGDIKTLLTLFSEVPYNGQLSTREVFRQEVMAVRHSGVHCGSWEMIAAANFLHWNLVSVYPNLGHFPRLMNRTFRPANPSTRTEAVMWTSNRQDMVEEHWVANHVVPLLPVTGVSKNG